MENAAIILLQVTQALHDDAHITSPVLPIQGGFHLVIPVFATGMPLKLMEIYLTAQIPTLYKCTCGKTEAKENWLHSLNSKHPK